MKRIKLFPLLICISVLFLGIGYAAINSIILDISGVAEANIIDDVVIKNVSYYSNNNADLDNSTITNYYETMMQSTISLSNTDGESNITYEVTIYNGRKNAVIFEGINHEPEFYDNNKIIYELSDINENEIIGSKEKKKFKITFKYSNNTVGLSNQLNSYLGFSFENYYSISYYGIDSVGLPTGIISGGTYQSTLPIASDSLKVVMNNNLITLNGNDYSYNENILTLTNVTGNIIIYNFKDPTINITSNDYTIVDNTIELTINIVNNNDYSIHYVNNSNSSNAIFEEISNTIDSNSTDSYTITLTMSDYNPANLLFSFDIPLSINYEKEVTFNNLSSDYYQIEYIESSKTQYIDTGITPNQDTGFDIEFLSHDEISTVGYGAILGARTKSKSNEFHLTTYSAVGNFGYMRYGTIEYRAGLVEYKLRHITLKNGVYTNHTLTNTTFSDITFTAPCTLTVFALNQNGKKTQYGALMLYFLKIYDGDTLVRDYVPVVRKSDGELGLYDLLNKNFKYNEGTGIFNSSISKTISYSLNYGTETTNPIIYNSYNVVNLNNPTKAGWTFSGWSGTGLEGNDNMNVTIPKGSTGDREYIAHYTTDNIVDYDEEGISNFTILSYIESTGVQYIDTNYIPNENSGYDIKFLSKDTITTSKYGTIFGVRATTSTNQFAISTYSGGIFGFGTKRYASGITKANELQEVSLRNRVYTNNAGETTEITDYGELNPNAAITLFGIFSVDTIEVIQRGKVQLYYFKLYDGDIMVRDYVPVRRNSDGKLGIYDRVENKFYMDFTENDNFLYAE